MIHGEHLQIGRQIYLLFIIWSTQVTIFKTTMFKIITRTTVLYTIKSDVTLRINHTPVKITIHYSEAVWFSDIWFRMNKITFINNSHKPLHKGYRGPPPHTYLTYVYENMLLYRYKIMKCTSSESLGC